jgi:hypothetical protein
VFSVLCAYSREANAEVHATAKASPFKLLFTPQRQFYGKGAVCNKRYIRDFVSQRVFLGIYSIFRSFLRRSVLGSFFIEP